MAVLSLYEILELKELVSPYGYVLHMHDACGGQSFTLEQVGDNPSEKAYEVIEKYFSAHQLTVNFFDNDRLNFVAK